MNPNVTEFRFPHIISIATPPHGLDAQTSRAIQDFHRARNIQVRFGRPVKNVCSWCFPDRATAEAFKERFGGKYKAKVRENRIKRTVPLIAAAFISDPVIYLISSGAELTVPFSLF
jgi:hypothetical protein